MNREDRNGGLWAMSYLTFLLIYMTASVFPITKDNIVIVGGGLFLLANLFGWSWTKGWF